MYLKDTQFYNLIKKEIRLMGLEEPNPLIEVDYDFDDEIIMPPVIGNLFIWNKTPNGHDYWHSVAGHFNKKYGNYDFLKLCKKDIQLELDFE